MLMILLLILVILALFGGPIGYSRYGYASWSPLGLVLLVILLLYFTGNFHWR
jgi:hypothetical protein